MERQPRGLARRLHCRIDVGRARHGDLGQGVAAALITACGTLLETGLRSGLDTIRERTIFTTEAFFGPGTKS